MRQAQIMANIDRDVQTFNDREQQINQERLIRATNFDDELTEKTERLTKTVKQTRGVKLQSLDMFNPPAEVTMSASF